jgi:putative endonuclease
MADDDTLVFVEVKTRTNEEFAKAQDAVTPAKRDRIIKAAKYFTSKYRLQNKPFRFDVVAIILSDSGKPEIRHYEKAFNLR